MDPLSTTASIIALVQAAAAIGKGVRALKTLKNAPEDFNALLKELTRLQAILRLTQTSLEALQSLPNAQVQMSGLDVIQELQIDLQRATRGMEELVRRLTLTDESEGPDDKMRQRVKLIKWYREKDSIAKLRAEVRQLHADLSTCFTAISVSTQVLVSSFPIDK